MPAESRFSDAEIEEQETAALRGHMAGVSFASIATQLSARTVGGEPIDEAVVRDRYESALARYVLDAGQVGGYRGGQMAQVEVAMEKVMTAVIRWDARHHEVSDLSGAVMALRRLQERADTLLEEQQATVVVPDELEGRRALTRKTKAPGSRKRTAGGK